MELPDLDELTLDGAPTGVNGRGMRRQARLDDVRNAVVDARRDRKKARMQGHRDALKQQVQSRRGLVSPHLSSNRLVAKLLYHPPPSASKVSDLAAELQENPSLIGKAWFRAEDLNPGGPFYGVLARMRMHTHYPDKYGHIVDLAAFEFWEQTRLLPKDVICNELTLAGTRLGSFVFSQLRIQNLWLDVKKGYYVRRDWSAKRIFVIGDIHGSLHSLLDILLDMYETQSAFTSRESGKLADDVGVVFLGDLLDRSPYTLECLYVALRLQRENPENCVLLAGNHESDTALWAHPSYGTRHEVVGEYGNACDPTADDQEESMLRRMRRVTQMLPSSLVAKTPLVTASKKLGIVQFNHGSFEDFDPGGAYHRKFVAFAEFRDPLAPDVMPTDGERDGSPLQWGDVAIAPLEPEEAREMEAGGRPTKSSLDVQTYLNRVGIRLLVRGHSDQANLSLLYREGQKPSEELNGEYAYPMRPDDPLYKFYGFPRPDQRLEGPWRPQMYNTFLRNGHDVDDEEVYDMFTLHVMPAELLVTVTAEEGTAPRFDKTLISQERGTNEDMLSVTVASCPFSKPSPPVEIMTCYLMIGPSMEEQEEQQQQQQQ